jgi:putative spermidine/putrescine transport system permease protein
MSEFVRNKVLVDCLDVAWRSLYPIAVTLGCLFLLAPMSIVVVMAFSSAPSIVFPPPSFTITRFLEIEPEITHAFFNSMRLGFSVIAVDLIICVPAAFALVRGRLPFSNLMLVLARSPQQIPGIAMAVAFYLYYSALERGDYISLRNNFAGLLIAHVVITSPYMLSTVTSQLFTVSTQLEDAASGLGAGSLRTLWFVTLPQIRASLIAGSFLAFVVSFEDVPVALFLSPAASETTLPVELFNLANDSLSPTLFSAAALVMLFSIVLVMAMEKLIGLRKAMSGF